MVEWLVKNINLEQIQHVANISCSAGVENLVFIFLFLLFRKLLKCLFNALQTKVWVLNIKIFLYNILLLLGCDLRTYIHFIFICSCYFLENETRCLLCLDKNPLKIYDGWKTSYPFTYFTTII